MSIVTVAVRKQVRERAGGRCEYCRKPDLISIIPFHVDHIIALKHDGTSDLDNLAWACFECNIAKGTDFASFDQLNKQLVFYYNPRLQQWHEHFEADGAVIVGKTPVGRVTVRRLQLNHSDQILRRLDLIAANQWP